ncbi:uncharacterized protein LOC143214408 [Lasioglossum baleicum]|uniref:uncharacterized protein LOC143214408 n=1 Tax=Lasioglossum baleicum TaxID=434251 RepID=UPI003FCCD344
MMNKRGQKTRGPRKKTATTFGEGKFTFANNDTYEGEYKMNSGDLTLVKQGKGLYTTDDFDKYDGEWNDDVFAGGVIHIRYNNNAEYEGNIDSNGIMAGPGTYVFPDGSSLEAVWFNNSPFMDIIYREPLGYKWVLHHMSRETMTFSPGNHFWDDMLYYQNTIDSTENA